MTRHCVCGKSITKDKSLCNECFEKYGSDPKKWEEWVRFLVADEQRELNRERHHQELTLDDERIHYPISDIAEHNLARAKHNPEMEFEDFIWNNQ